MEEVEKRLGNLSIFSSTESLDEITPLKGRKISQSMFDLMKETQENTRFETPTKDFEEFLERRINSSNFTQRCTEEEFGAMFKILGFIGEGATSSVMFAVREEDDRDCAIKVINGAVLDSHKSLFREVSILSSIDHPNVIKLYGSFLTESHLYLVMEYAEGEQVCSNHVLFGFCQIFFCSEKKLFDHIVRKNHYFESDCRELVRTILQALSYLHGLGIAHRDLKPENIVGKKLRL